MLNGPAIIRRVAEQWHPVFPVIIGIPFVPAKLQSEFRQFQCMLNGPAIIRRAVEQW
jgi:hypothetical protein